MNNENILKNQKKSNKKVLRIIIPICMIVIIGIIGIIKNIDKLKINKDNIDYYSSDFDLETDYIDLEILKQYNLPIIIDFGSDTCTPCIEMAPVLEQMNEKMQNKAIIKFVDISKNKTAAAEFPIQIIPSQVIYNENGEVYIPSSNVSSIIDFIIYEDTETGNYLFTIHQGALTESEMQMILSDMGVE